MTLDFHLYALERGLQVAWDAELGTDKSPVHRWLVDTLRQVPGIEYAELRRYSISLHIAQFVTDPDAVVYDVAQWLQDPELRFLASQALNDPELQVVVY